MAKDKDRRDDPASTETLRDWETVQQDADESKTQRLRIQQGWLYRTVVDGIGVSMIFVPAAFPVVGEGGPFVPPPA